MFGNLPFSHQAQKLWDDSVEQSDLIMARNEYFMAEQMIHTEDGLKKWHTELL